jgi:hypothetical protein
VKELHAELAAWRRQVNAVMPGLNPKFGAKAGATNQKAKQP